MVNLFIDFSELFYRIFRFIYVITIKFFTEWITLAIFEYPKRPSSHTHFAQTHFLFTNSTLMDFRKRNSLQLCSFYFDSIWYLFVLCETKTKIHGKIYVEHQISAIFIVYAATVTQNWCRFLRRTIALLYIHHTSPTASRKRILRGGKICFHLFYNSNCKPLFFLNQTIAKRFQ